MKQKQKAEALEGQTKNWGTMNRRLSRSVLPKKQNVISGVSGLAIDKKSRYIFPLGFFLFNIVYWITVFIQNGMFSKAVSPMTRYEGFVGRDY